MNAQKLSQSVVMAAIITLFLAGCGAPQAAPQTQAPKDTATPEAPIATNTLPLPTFTATPAWNVEVGGKIILGPAEVMVTRLEEAQTSPVQDKPPKAGMKFILIELKIISLAPGEKFASDRLFLETSSGKQYSTPRVYGKDPVMGGRFEAGSGTVSGSVEAFNIFFEVATGESLSSLLLSYQ